LFILESASSEIFIVLLSLHHVNVEIVANILEVYPSSVLRVSVSRVSQCSYVYGFLSNRSTGGGGHGGWGLVRDNRDSEQQMWKSELA
jgi:hypothetical protein